MIPMRAVGMFAIAAVLSGVPSLVSAANDAGGWVDEAASPAIMGISGALAALTILAAAVALARRRRRSAAETAGVAPSVEDEVAAALHRRTVRRSRRRIDDAEDPIIASLGVSPEGEPRLPPD